MFVGDGGWLGGLALTAAIISVPLQYWIRHLANNWPSSYDACLRARVPEDEEDEGEGTAAALEIHEKREAPPGATMLRLASMLAPLLSVVGFALAIAFYVDDVEGAACLRVRTSEGVEYVDRTPYYPWDWPGRARRRSARGLLGLCVRRCPFCLHLHSRRTRWHCGRR